MWKLKRFATHSLELELSTRSTNDKKQDFCKSWPLEERTSSGTQLWCLSKILIFLAHASKNHYIPSLSDLPWEGALLADGCELGVRSWPGPECVLYQKEVSCYPGNRHWAMTALQLGYWIKGVLLVHQLSCFTGVGQTVQVKPIKCSRHILVCDWQDVWDILPRWRGFRVGLGENI